jgi:hypothetical protein
MENFVILRRNGWESAEDLGVAAGRSTDEGNKMDGDIKWIRSYVFTEPDGTLGTVCIYQAKDAETVRKHAGAAALPATEVLPIADVVVVNPDPQPATA